MAAFEAPLAWIVLLVLLGAIVVIDVRTHRIPNALTLALLVSGGVVAMVPGGPGFADALAGALLGGLSSLAVALGFRWWRGVDGLGMGDVKFLAGAGSWTGWQGVGPVVFVAATAALLAVGVLTVTGRAPGRREPFAFGPFLCFALIVVRGCQTLVTNM